jgi:ATP-binding cassette, subfamily B, bacterial
MAKRIPLLALVRNRSQWVRVRQLVGQHRRQVAILSIASFLGGAVEALFLVVVTRAALSIADGGDTTGVFAGIGVPVAGAIGVAAVLLVVRLALAVLAVARSAALSAAVLATLRQRLAHSYLSASWAMQQGEPSGQLQVLAGFAGAGVGSVGAFTTTITAMLNLLALVVIAFVIDPAATLAVIVALVGFSVLLAPIRRRIKLRAATAATAQMEYSTALTELGVLGLEMQTFGAREQFAQRIDALSASEARVRRRAQVLQGSLGPVYTALVFGALVLALGVGAIVGVDELSAVGAVMLVMLRALSYGQQLQSASGSLMSSLPFLERLEDTLDRYEASRASGGDVVLGEVGALHADQLTFSYQADRPALDDVSFEICQGEILGVVGPSGAGKSTLVQLLLGLRDPVTGTVRAGSVDLRNVDRASWTGRVSFVPQEAQLFTGTVEENIRFFRELDDGAVRHAASQANILAEIEAMADGFKTFLGERGTRLSGGQRQRLCIARALAGEPDLLLLDEPTSALDPHSEALVRKTLSDLRGAVTVVIIAHRMSTLDICDRIMVLESGRLTAIGSPAAVRRNSNFYNSALDLSAGH